MDKIQNIEVFALSVAEIMDELYTAFPVPTMLSASRVTASYGYSKDEFKPRIVQPYDADYESLLSQGFHLNADLHHAAGQGDLENFHARAGEPFQYWTGAQRRAIEAHLTYSREAEYIHGETINFLAREGYVAETPLSNSRPERCRRSFVLTSKGFSQLNKKFEGGTIRDEFHFSIAKKFAGAAKTGSDLASIVEAAIKLFGQNG